MRHWSWILGMVLLLTSGCSSARLVSSTPTDGCVAIADNSDQWPSYNMTKAKELMSKQFPTGYKIVRQEEVVTGQTTVNNTQRDTQQVPLARGLVTDVQQTTRDTTEVRNRTEWRIWFQKN